MPTSPPIPIATATDSLISIPTTSSVTPANFMNMLWRMTEPKYSASPVIARALDVLFILHADHEQNCSSTTMRVVGSAQADPYLCDGGRRRALSGPLHGGANEEVLRMLAESAR